MLDGITILSSGQLRCVYMLVVPLIWPHSWLSFMNARPTVPHNASTLPIYHNIALDDTCAFHLSTCYLDRSEGRLAKTKTRKSCSVTTFKFERLSILGLAESCM